MENICPICNKTIKENISCEICNDTMYDLGRVQEFRDSYGNGEEIENINNGCLHYFQCNNCNNLKKVYFKSVKI